MANAETENEVKERGRRSPSYPLNEAIGFLQQVHEGLGDGPSGKDALAKALGHQGVSGAVTTKIGTLTHFALLEREGNVYKTSAIGRRILFPRDQSERTSAIAEAFQAPSLYREIVTAYTSKALPALFANVLIQTYGVLPGNAEQVATCFRQSAEFAGLMRNGVLYAELGSIPALANSAKTPNAVQPPDASQSADRLSTSSAYTIPLTRGRIAALSIPRGLAESDHARIIAWLELMKDVLLAVEEVGNEAPRP